MKHLKNLLLTGLMMSLMTFISCGGVSQKAIDEKIKKDGIEAKFTSVEYDAMIGYLEKLIKDNPQYDSEDDMQMEQFGDDLGKMFTYMMVLGLAKDNGELSSSQMSKFEEIANLATQLNNNEVYIDSEEYVGNEYSEDAQTSW